MNVTVQELAPCKKLVRFEVTAEEVEKTFEATAKDFMKHAALPGFRPGKAPKEMVLKQFDKDIAEEVKRKLIGETYRSGIKEQKLDVLGYPDIEEIQFERGKPLQFAATVETSPSFEMPEYRGLPARREARSVTEEDLKRALEALRGQQAKFEKVDRELKEGDFAVVNYTGTCEGKPITDLAPTAKGLTEQKNFWIEAKPDSFIPGFAAQLLGAKSGDKRTVTVDFPADFVTPQLAGKQGVFEVELVEVKERRLPEIDDAFAKSYDAENLDKLREGVRQDLQNELNQTQKKNLRNQVLRALLDKVQFDLPESMVQHETRSVVYDIVNENQKRGVPKDAIERQKDEIYSVANQSARERVKTAFLFKRIAEKEGIRVTPEEVNARVVTLAHLYQMPPKNFLKELEKRDGLDEIVQQLVHEKILNFLHEHAKIEDVPAAPATSPA